MPRYHAPRWLRKYAGPRILAELSAADDLDETVDELRAMHPKPAALILVVDPGGRSFQWTMNHPEVDMAVLGRPDLDELATAWPIDFLCTRDGEGHMRDRRVDRDG